MKVFLHSFIISFTILFSALAQENFTLTGVVKDASNGEDLIGATVYVEELKSGTQTNVYGFYSLTIPGGEYKVVYRYIGF